MNTYRNESSNPKTNAQRNLMGRTHYVDDDSLRWHKSRILSSHASSDGFLFYLIESCAADMNNTRRVCRFVIFDVFGTVIARPDLENSFKRNESARKAMYKVLNDIDVKKITLNAIANAEIWHHREMQDLRGKLDAIETKAA